jgi:hypothetical protein
MVMKKTIAILLGVTFLLDLSTCLDEIGIELPDRPEEGYIIQATLIKGSPSVAEVRVERAFQYTSNINQPVADAEVRLMKENGFIFSFPSNQFDGIYDQQLDQQNYPIAVGDRFRLEVQIGDSVLILSDWETIHEAPQARQLEWTLSEVETVSTDGLVNRLPGIAFSVSTPVHLSNNNRSQLRWEFIDAYRVSDNMGQVCYIENPYQNAAVFLLDGNAISSDTVQRYPLFSAPLERRHIEGYYLSAYQQSLGPAAFGYWQEVASLLDRQGTIFDNPAGTVSTNFSDQADATRLVHGFFTAYSQDTVRLFISREEMGELPFYCPRPPTNLPNPAPTVCDNCVTNGFNSSLNKPYYWEE